MNLYDIRLLHVRLEEIRATPFTADDDDDDSYQAELAVEFVGSVKDINVGDEFEISIVMTALSNAAPFFTMAMIGTFEVLAQPAVKDLSHVDAPYELGSLLYPYIRNLAKPIIEYLGASTVDIPFAPPPPPPQTKKPARKKRSNVV